MMMDIDGDSDLDDDVDGDDDSVDGDGEGENEAGRQRHLQLSPSGARRGARKCVQERNRGDRKIFLGGARKSFRGDRKIYVVILRGDLPVTAADLPGTHRSPLGAQFGAPLRAALGWPHFRPPKHNKTKTT